MRKLNSLITVVLLSLSTTAAVGCATSDLTSGDDTSVVDGDASAAGKFDLWQATDGQWHFHLKSGNGAILLTSEAYTSRTGAIGGVLSMLNNGVDSAQYQLAVAAHGYTLHLVAGNNEIIGFTEVYASKSSATRAIGSCTHAVTSYLDKREANTTGQFHFNFVAQNGQTVLTSESYTTEAAAYNGALAVQGVSATGYAIISNNEGGYYFTVTADNGQVVGISQQYASKSAATAGVKAVQKLVPTITVL